MLEMLKTMRAEAERAKIYAEAKLEVVDRLISEVDIVENSETDTPEEAQTEVENPAFEL